MATPIKLKPASIAVCYKTCSTGNIEWGNITHTVMRGRELAAIFDDGGWNPAADCFFTEDQYRRHHGLPPEGRSVKLSKIADRLEAIAHSLR